MTDETKYNELLKEIGQVLSQKNSDISYLEYRIKELEKKLSNAERMIADKVFDVPVHEIHE